MATQCGDILTKEIQEQLSEANEEGMRQAEDETSGRLWEEYAREMPAIEAALETRIIECLKENVENGRRDYLEMLAKSGVTDAQTAHTNLEKLDLLVEPTDQDYKIMLDVAKEMDKVKDLEVIDMPVITAIKGDESFWVKDPELQEMGHKDDIEKIPHLDQQTTTALARATMDFLCNGNGRKIPEEWKDQATVNMIVGVDKQEPGSEEGKIAVEKASHPDELKERIEAGLKQKEYVSRNLYLFQNSAGKLVPSNAGEQYEFQWKIAHGIFHINDAADGRFDTIIEDSSEWETACKAQLKFGVVDDAHDGKWPYQLSDIQPGSHNHADVVQYGKEFRAQHFAGWVMDSPKLCPQMKIFFDKHFS